MMATPPQRTPEELQEARNRAVEARRARAKLLEGVRSGRLTVEDVLLQGRYGQGDTIQGESRVAGRIKAGKLLRAVKGIGPQRAKKILAVTGVAEDERLDQLSADQADALILATDRR